MKSPKIALSLVSVLLAAVVLSTATLALDENQFNYETTKDLVQVCSVEGTGEGAVQAALACRAFLEATVQYHDAVTDRKKMKRLICYSSATTIETARKTFVAWGARHANDAKLMGELPVVGVVRALAEAFPCK